MKLKYYVDSMVPVIENGGIYSERTDQESIYAVIPKT